MTNRTTGEDVLMALFSGTTRTAHIQFDYNKHRFLKNDTYNLRDDLMDELDRRQCRVIRITEINRPNHQDAWYEVPFDLWYAQETIDYGFGAGAQYPMSCTRIRGFVTAP